MSNSIQKYQLEDNIRFLYFRYRGNVSAIVEGLKKLPGYKDSNIDPVYVAKIVKKFKTERKRDWNINICYTFMEYLHVGAQERLARCHQWLDNLESAAEILVSTCHKVPVGEKRNEGGELEYICLEPSCGKVCSTMILHESGIYDLRIRLLDEMRKDEALLLKAIKDLGLSGTEAPKYIERITNYNLGLKVSSPHLKHVDANETEVVENTKNFTPMMREKLIKDVEQTLENEDINEQKE